MVKGSQEESKSHCWQGRSNLRADSVQTAYPPILWFLNHEELKKKNHFQISSENILCSSRASSQKEGHNSFSLAFLLLCSCLLLLLLMQLVYILYTDGRASLCGGGNPNQNYLFSVEGKKKNPTSAKKASGKLEFRENICLDLFRVQLSLTDRPHLTWDNLASTPQHRSRGRI